MKILIVEDDAAPRDLLAALLRARGHEPHAFPDATGAVDAFATGDYPLVILDRFLPSADGLELCRQMRATPAGAGAFILVFTIADSEDDVEAALRAGADDYLVKPLMPNVLSVRLTIAEQWVRQLIARRRAEAERDTFHARLKSSHADVLSILNRLRIGTAITDPEGHLTFLSETAQSLFDLKAEHALGQRWDRVLPIRPEDRAELHQQLRLPPEQRSRVPIHVETRDHRHHWMQIDLQDDPRNPQRKIFALYDVTAVEEIRRQLTEGAFHELIGRSEPMQAVYQFIRELARVDTTALLEGETGTGKELAARAIHRASPRRAKPFIPVNCAGLPESLVSSLLFGHRRGAFTGAVEDHVGVFESANGGTLFLDEIGDVPPAVQTSLLRVLQEREITRLGETRPRKIDVRVLAATHHDLGQLVERGGFRMDLLYRIRVARLTLPPLRDRRADIPLLSVHFLDELGKSSHKVVKELSPKATEYLMSYAWPGNVRELRGAMEFAMIRARDTVIQPGDLPPEILQSVHSHVLLTSDPHQERARILDALSRHKGNRTEAARFLGMSRATFYRHLRTLNIDLK